MHRLVEANQASTYAASLQADLNKDLLSFALSRTTGPTLGPTPPSLPTQSEPPAIQEAPKSLSLPPREVSPPHKVVRYKKFWSDEGTPDSDVSLTDLPTEEISFLGAAKRVPLEKRITAELQKLETRIEPPSPKSLLERLQPPSPNPYGFDAELFKAPKEFPLPKEQPNLYRDSRRPRRH